MQMIEHSEMWFSVARGIEISPELIEAVDVCYRSSHCVEEMLTWSHSDIEWDPLVQWIHQEVNLNAGSPDEAVLAVQFACTDQLHGFWRFTAGSSRRLETSVQKSFAAAIRARLTMADSLRAFEAPSWLNPNWIAVTNILFSCQLNPRLASRPLCEWPATSVKDAAEQFLPDLKGDPLKNILQELSVLVEKQRLEFTARNEKSPVQEVLVWMLENPKGIQRAWGALPRAHQRRLGGESFLSAFITLWEIGTARFHRWLDCSALMVTVHERANRQ